MAREFYDTSLKDFLKDFVGDEALSYKFEEGLKKFVATRSEGDKMEDILHLLTKEELLKICIDTFEIEIFLKRLDEKRREFSAGKIFNDPIHGSMEIHPACVLIIDTPQFQRLRYIKQLGMCYFVFPGASHNRFEHSIGTCYLAGQFCRSLRENQPELGITDMDILCVEIAGLCHDLGHGPFSRLFVDRFLPKHVEGNGHSRREYARKHKVPSALMFDFLLRENVAVKRDLATKYDIWEKELKFIKEQIDGPPVTGSTAWPYKGRKEHKAYLYEIVSNLRNGIDVCKWDYMARDCHHLGLRNNFDHSRYMKFARVIEESGEHQICLRDKEAGNVYNMFYTRYTLNKYAYKHPANCAIEEMVVDILKKVEDNLSFGREDFFDVLKKAEEHLQISKEWVVDVVKKAEEHFKVSKKCAMDILENAPIDSTDASSEVNNILTEAQEDFKGAIEKVNNILTEAQEDFKGASEKLVNILKQAHDEGLNLGSNGLSMSKCQKDGGSDGMRALSELTDDVLYKIRYDRNPALKDSQKILQRIYERKLYTCVYKSGPLDLTILTEKINVKSIKETIVSKCPSLQDDDSVFYVQIVHLDFGMKEENPVRRLKVFGKDNLYEARHLPKKEVSRILCPPNHNEQEIRFYSKSTKDDDRVKLKKAAEESIKYLKDKIKEVKKQEKK